MQNCTHNIPECSFVSINILMFLHQVEYQEQISLGKKAVGGVLFGLFSSDIRKTMHCKNCGYKW